MKSTFHILKELEGNEKKSVEAFWRENWKILFDGN
jgi:hypothetical protein